MSVSPPHHVLEFDDLDIATSRLIAKLMLEDIAEIDARHKGKARADTPLSDQELALREQRQYWENSLRLIDDHVMAKSMNDAMTTDHRFIRAVTVAEQAAQDDRRAALALSNGGHLPPQSNAQRSVESKTFSIPDPGNESPSLNVVSAAARKGGLPQKIVYGSQFFLPHHVLTL
ncbi:hypothetical protein H0H93_006957 [Arthromyces matolae]|nr:hypothetical protein H0H93_006957 [Arthromyces matolae]